MRYFGCVIVILLVIVSSFYFFNRNKFYPVITGEVYRSAQLSTDSLEQYIKENNIQSILNLRGSQPQDEWYQAEKALSSRLNIIHYDIGLGAYRLPSIYKLRNLLKLLAQLSKPYLIHCDGGVDRTGLVSVILLLLEGKQSLPQIEKHVSWRYFAFSNKSAGKLFFNQYKSWLTTNKLKHYSSLFSEWLRSGYVDGKGNLGFYIDSVNDKLPALNPKGIATFNIKRSPNSRLSIQGWAVDHDNKSLISSIEVLLSQAPAQKNEYGHARPDVGVYFGIPDYTKSGWTSEYNVDALTEGCHQLQLRITRLDGSVWLSLPRTQICISD